MQPVYGELSIAATFERFVFTLGMPCFSRISLQIQTFGELMRSANHQAVGAEYFENLSCCS